MIHRVQVLETVLWDHNTLHPEGPDVFNLTHFYGDKQNKIPFSFLWF